MIFIVDANGSVTKIGASSIYQGSVKAGQLILLAPLPASLSVTVGFTLPNGVSTAVRLAQSANMADVDLNGILLNTNGVTYNAWIYTMQAEVTEYAGTVTVQFFCHSSASEVLTTYSAEIEVLPGVAIELPATPTQTIYDDILSTLAMVNAKLGAIEGSTIIQYVEELPTTNINSQVFYVIGENVYIYVGSEWVHLNEVIVPITDQSQASATAQKLYLLNGELYAYINNAFTRMLNANDYATLYNLANTANANATQANNAASNANTVAGNAQSTANTASTNASEALSTANEALSKAQEALNSLTSVITFVGSVAFANLPTPSASTVNTIYNVTDAFTTTSDFVEGSGKTYPAGTNVAIVLNNGSYKYDVLSGFVDLSGYQAKLVSGENIKTINGASILGSGNIEVEGEQGEQGVGIANITTGNPVVGSEYTTTPLTITYTNGTTQTINIQADNGADGSDGAEGTSITEVTAGTPSQNTLNQTVTPLAITFSNGNIATVNVVAKNGADGVDITSVTTGTPSQNTMEQTVTPLVFTFSNGTTQTVNVAVYNGKDGSSIESISSGTPTQGTGANAGYTATPLSFYKSTSSWITATAWAKNGEEGVGISSVTAGEPTESDGYTSTPITVKKTDNTTDTFNVLAKNGADSEGGSGIPTLTTQTVTIADLEAGVYLWDYEGEKTLNYGDSTETIYSNPVLLQISDYAYEGYTCKFFYLVDCSNYPENIESAIVYGTMYIYDDGSLEAYCGRKYLRNIPEVEAYQVVDTISPQTISGDKTFDDEATFEGNATFNGIVNFSGAKVIGLSGGSGGLTKTKVTLAQLKSIMSTTTFAGDLISIVVKYDSSITNSSYLYYAMTQLGGVFSIALNTSKNACVIDTAVGATTMSESEIYSFRRGLYITSTSAYVTRDSYSYDIQNATFNNSSSDVADLTDASCDFYIITANTSSIPQ